VEALRLQGYYAIVDVKGTSVDFGATTAHAARLLAAAPCCLQLRAKQLGLSDFCELGHRLRQLCTEAGVPLCITDRVDVALVVAADAVHLGQGDLPLREAVRLRGLGRHRFAIGISTHDVEEARAAEAGGADHIGFGPVFATRSKADAGGAIGLERLGAVVQAVRLPVIAIGGIDLANVADVVAAGAAAAAAIAAVDEAEDSTAAGRAIAAAFLRSPKVL
jgi:thiamine-phosphate pyrophosphorylase